MLSRIWKDLFILYLKRGDWAKAKEYLTRIEDKKLRWEIVFMITGADVLTDPEWTKKLVTISKMSAKSGRSLDDPLNFSLTSS